MGEALHLFMTPSLPAKLLRSFPGELTSTTGPRRRVEKAVRKAAGQVFESGGTGPVEEETDGLLKILPSN